MVSTFPRTVKTANQQITPPPARQPGRAVVTRLWAATKQEPVRRLLSAAGADPDASARQG